MTGECPKCDGKGYIKKYGAGATVGAVPFGVTVLSPPCPVIGLKVCPLCKGFKEVEIKET